ncbi:MAG: hypothetical protein Q7R66_13370 [Undibacterium sp.]|uniref:hypothetical protein n=1 Tax=Undibacterium sp. TaxID=1914977 RepID=UPI0027236401|nr:hypothetical protein [Undibacterium sp.]MDO8653169.1 hypothetical protein [Undibacterium sp.]
MIRSTQRTVRSNTLIANATLFSTDFSSIERQRSLSLLAASPSWSWKHHTFLFRTVPNRFNAVTQTVYQRTHSALACGWKHYLLEAHRISSVIHQQGFIAGALNACTLAHRSDL